MTRKPLSHSRRPLTKAQLLPLPVDQVRALSLKHHLALAMLRDGRGDIEAIITLLNVLYLAFFLRDSGPAALDSCQRAEVALDDCIRRAERGEPWSVADTERQALEELVVTHDAQLAAAPAYRYLDAWEQVQRVMASGGRSPIPAAA
ncbi:hypothetical protein OIV57_23020 [Burkholderia pseudomallei]|uniref:hypothetical protein n=1 Tax=Burkholderia TaxID=32008 RepID=UPI00064BDDF0|nr:MULTISPECIES: hypothetical protein [Burkholderia]AKM05455.1 hypothetical protein ABD05_34910 [Burkholderia pyrrocinia]MCV9915008.1 hypothetical protein [Burkholderia pseudomallei]MCW0071046.1 hypothetical protein [Burkholderia pseudomallei]TCW75615.1 hypothetical protein C5O80_37740 [Burkholderia sp. SRS-46]